MHYILLEDHDGAPFPESTQILWWQMCTVISPDDRDDFKEYLIDALTDVYEIGLADA